MLLKATLAFKYFYYQLLSDLLGLRAVTLFTLLGSWSLYTLVPDTVFGEVQKGEDICLNSSFGLTEENVHRGLAGCLVFSPKCSGLKGDVPAPPACSWSC